MNQVDQNVYKKPFVINFDIHNRNYFHVLNKLRHLLGQIEIYSIS